MAGFWADMFGTLKSKFQIGGTAGTTLKNSSGNLVVRNAADSADAEITTSKANVSGPDIVLDSDGNALTVSRNSTQSGALQVIFPPAKATDGQVLAQKAGTGAGIVEFEFVSAGSTSSANKIDTTSLAFGSTSPVTMFTTGASDVITEVEFIIDTAFDGAPTASVGISGNTSKYTSSSTLDLTAAAGTSFKFYPNMTAQGAEALIITYSAGGASAGAARVHVYYATPA